MPKLRIAMLIAPVAVALALVEGACFLLVRTSPDLFDQRSITLQRLTADRLEERNRSPRANDSLGWDNPLEFSGTATSCHRRQVATSYGSNRERLHGSGRPEQATILVAGDSFTHGDDVSDEESYPAELERLLAVPTANLGVGGYSPFQALLKLEAVAERFPAARIVVLSILYENGYRIVNGYWPARQQLKEADFLMRPHIEDGQYRDLSALKPFQNIVAMRAAAEAYFDHDFWRRAKPSFPFTAAVAKMLYLPSYWVPRLSTVETAFGSRRYELFYRLPSIQINMRALYDRFLRFAQARNMVPVIAMIPVDGDDQASGLAAIAAATAEQRERITFINVLLSRPDRYQRAPCHPDAEGYSMIAASVAAELKKLLH